MSGQRAVIGAAVKCGFLKFFCVGHTNNGRLVRDATGMNYYWQINYGGINKVDVSRDEAAMQIMQNAAQFDPIVKSFFNNIAKVA